MLNYYIKIFLSSLVSLEVFVIYYSSLFKLNYFLCLFFSFLGCFFWNQFTFFIGKSFSEIVIKTAYFVDQICYIKEKLSKYKVIFILVFRYLYGLKLSSPFLLGVLDIEDIVFIKKNLLASFLWSFVYCNIGYILGVYKVINDEYFNKFVFFVFIFNIFISAICSICFFIYEKYFNYNN